MLVRKGQRGVSLVELLVGVAIALVLITGATLVYVNSLRGTTTSSAMSRVNQDLRTIMMVIENDLHRAGFWSGAAIGAASNPFADRTGGTGNVTDLFVSPDRRCILYAFDIDVDGTVDSNVFAGFWFDSNSRTLKVLNQAGGNPVTDTSNIGNCAGYSWLPMNYPDTVNITDVTFSTGGSQCIAFAPASFAPASSATFTRWQLDPASSAANFRAGCDVTAAGAPQGTPLLPASSLDPNAPAIQTGQTKRSEVRQIVVSITANHSKDPSATRTLATVIRLRNDRMQ